MKNFFKNKKGMTYVELLVAFTLLVLVITVFSPMLLSSYGTLYDAGEKNVKTYSAKSKVEDQLAFRSSTDIVYNMQTNFKNIGEMSKINVRRITEGLTDSYSDMISTLFYNGKGYIRLISSSRVNDDENSKTFVFQTSGFVIDDVEYDGTPSKDTDDGGKTYHYVISLAIYKPDKSKTSQEEVYSTVYDGSNVHIDTGALSSNGIIRITVKGVDLTNSPLKMVLRYYDENAEVPNKTEEIREISTFLYIDPPTIMLGGNSATDNKENRTLEYFTSAGLVKDNAGNMSLQIDGRDMSGLSYTSGTSIKNISWINNDTIATANGFNPYYVLTGTNGTIARLYSATDETSYGKMTDNSVTTEKPFPITDKGIRRTFYPIAWGGDYSHEFKYSSYYQGLGYGVQEDNKDDNCWITENSADVYGTQAKYTYYYNGNNTEFYFKFQNGRTISYILSEYGEALRFFGVKADSGDFAKYTSVWDKENLADIYKNQGNWLRSNTDTTPFFYRTKDNNDNGDFTEGDFSSLRIKALQSFPDQGYLFEDLSGDSVGTSATASYNRYKANSNPTDLTVTDAVYMPESGKVLYLGSKSAYVYFRQQDAYDKTNATYYALKDIDSGLTGSDRYKTRKANKPTAYFTGYYIAGDSSATGGSIIRKVYSQSTEFDNLTNTFKSLTGLNTVEKSSGGKDIVLTANSDAASKFFVDRTNHCYRFSDVEFTLGYASDRSMVFNNITYDGTNENYKSYENLYFKSHYSDGATANSDGTSSHSIKHTPVNSADNDYYNVWFPGECYNMIKVATKEGVSVGVGYSVSGSVYQHITPKAAGTYNSFSWSDVGRGSLFSFNTVQKTISANTVFNTSTSLGGVFNDGVLGVSVNGSAFTNVLYFKDNATMNSNYLTNGSGVTDQSAYKNAFTTYGTHARNSIQFTAVDLLVEGGTDAGGHVEDVTSETKTYTAYYGDNTGRVFKSLVATATSTGIEGTSSAPVAVGFIADTTYAGTTTPPSRMEEIKIQQGNSTVSISTVFDKITNIVADGGTVIVSGTTKAAGAYVVIGQKAENGTWTWKAVKITDKNYIINDAAICEGVYYACGEVGSSGFFMAVDLGDINSALSSATTSDISNYIISTEKMIVPSDGLGSTITADSPNLPKLYSIAARGSGS